MNENSEKIKVPDTFLKGPDYRLSEAWRRVPRYIIVTFVAAFVLGFLVHGFMFANKFLNHDDIGHLFGSDYGRASGRWLLPFVLRLDGVVSAPWLIGILSLLLLSASACLTVSVLRIRSAASCVLTAALLVSFPAVGATFTYMFSADAYFLSLLLACLAAYITVKRRFGFVAGIALTALSMGIYQSYFAVTAALLVTALILQTLDGEKSVGQLLLTALRYLAAVAIGLLLYYIIVKITTRSTGLVDYMGLSSMGSVSLSTLPGLILDAYKGYYRLSKFDSLGIDHHVLLALLAAAFLGASVLAVSLLRRKRPGLARLALLAVFALVLPLAGGAIYVMSPDGVHHLMIYGLCCVLLAPLVLFEYRRALLTDGETSGVCAAASWLIIISLALTAFNYCVFTNEAYMKMELSREQTAAYSNRLVSAIESFEKYDENTPVVIVGEAFANVEVPPSPELMEIQMTGALGTQTVINNYTYANYLRYYMGIPNVVHNAGTAISDNLAANPAVKAMPSYPAKGGIAWVNGYIVVKLSDTMPST